MERRPYFGRAKRVVVKVGSNVLTGTNGLDTGLIASLARQISEMTGRGLEVLLVSSGAMAAGQKKMEIACRPEDIPGRQAVAAIGQAGLMLAYETAFATHGRKVAQILLTIDDLRANRRRYLNARNTINTLISWLVIPVINENDTVAVDEIRFGDNDNLSALIALMMDADLLINLTDIDGLYTGNPRTEKTAEKISLVPGVTRRIERYASGIPGTLGTGGMLTKIKAAKKITAAGIPMVIADGHAKNILIRLFSGEILGTFFMPAESKLSNRKCWIGFTLKPKGSLSIDAGAGAAITGRGKSLLPGGIVGVTGEFAAGEPVEIVGADGVRLATGLVNYNAADIRKIMGNRTSSIKEILGQKPYDEVIHRNNMTVLGECLEQ
ncbi:MAG: glutamate 5-kinase [Deltaproteobacteria bacterium]|nr:glutamate 5-kinase [Deltaproteobacteria bacterium]